ncbi:MAG: glycerol kinase [Deltaproteobacteria bacterium]|nr:glycerol kinase [Deltaproteobacteria bacterium]
MRSPQYVLALDEGSSGVRAVLLDVDGRVAGRAYREVAASYPQPGWVEHDAEAVWNRTLEVARAALAAAGARGAAVAAIGVTGQRSTAVAWSRQTGRPLHPAISWQDVRTAERCAELLAAGNFASPLGAATKLEWLRRNVGTVRAAADRGEALFGTLESFLVWKLSAGRAYVTDPSFASVTCLFDFFTNGWSPAMLAALDLREDALPEIRASSEAYAEADPVWIGAAAPIAALAGDQQAAVFGQLCLDPGTVKISYGTSAMCNLNVGRSLRFSSTGAFPLALWRIGDELHYCLEGHAITAGAAVQWLRDGLGVIADVADSDAIGRSVPDTGGVWAVPAFQGLGTPHFDPAARATIGGLARGTTRAHVVRAVLEGVALRCAEVFDALAADSPAGRPSALRADGGAARNDLLLQLQSDLLGVPVERPEILEAAAAGVAYLAGLAVGFWSDVAALRGLWRCAARFEPRLSEAEREERRERFRKRVAAVREVAS